MEREKETKVWRERERENKMLPDSRERERAGQMVSEPERPDIFKLISVRPV